MHKLLADTTVLVDNFRGNKHAQIFLKKFTPSITTVTLADLIQGSQSKSELKNISLVCSELSFIAVDTKISSLAIALLKTFHLSHGLFFFDALIAASAIENKLILVTNNTKHFRFIKDLEVITHKEAFQK